MKRCVRLCISRQSHLLLSEWRPHGSSSHVVGPGPWLEDIKLDREGEDMVALSLSGILLLHDSFVNTESPKA